MQLFVRTLTGATLTVDITGEETVTALKAKIAQETGIPSDQIRLICGMSMLEDEMTLSEANVQAESNVIMTLGLDGGKKKKKRKPHTTPKVIAHKHATIKMRLLNYFEVAKDGKVNKLKKGSTISGCYLADHKDRMHCGRTGLHMFYKLTAKGEKIAPVQNKSKKVVAAAPTKAAGGAKKKK